MILLLMFLIESYLSNKPKQWYTNYSYFPLTPFTFAHCVLLFWNFEAAKDREKNEKLSKEKKIKKSLRRKRGLLSFFCFPILIITFIKASFRDTRESFLLVTTKMIVTCCQTIPLTTMFVCKLKIWKNEQTSITKTLT